MGSISPRHRIALDMDMRGLRTGVLPVLVIQGRQLETVESTTDKTYTKTPGITMECSEQRRY